MQNVVESFVCIISCIFLIHLDLAHPSLILANLKRGKGNRGVACRGFLEPLHFAVCSNKSAGEVHFFIPSKGHLNREEICYN